MVLSLRRPALRDTVSNSIEQDDKGKLDDLLLQKLLMKSNSPTSLLKERD
jgi:hypothetical protein